MTRPDEPQRRRRTNAAPTRSSGSARPRPSTQRKATQPKRPQSRGAAARAAAPRQTPSTGRPPARRRPPAPPREAPFAAFVRTRRRKRRDRRNKGPFTFQLGSQSRRLHASFIVVAIVMSVFAARLIQLQGIDADAYATQARDARLRTVILPADRGDIVDTFGVPLATTVDTVAITADPKQTAPKAAEIAGIIAPLIDGDAAKITKALQTKDSRFVYLARQVDQSDWKKVRTSLATAKLVGVSTEADPKRVYPAGSVAAAMIGFVGRNEQGTVGRAGLEASLNDTLAGKSGKQTYEASSKGPALPLGHGSMQEPVAGKGVQLTIDADLQYLAQKAIAEAVAKTKADSGDAIIIDVKTGRIMAMATAPTYDANKGSKTNPKLLVDHPVTDAYEPGSVFKLFTAAALLDQGLVTPTTKEMVPGYLYRDGSRIKDWFSHGTLRMTFAGAIAQSSNVGTILAAEQMSPQLHDEYLDKFGIGRKTDVGLPGETAGLLASPDKWTPLRQATIAFGQGVSVNALQMASGVAAIANGGVRVAPTLIQGYIAADGTVTPAPAPAQTRVISPEASKQLLDIMEQVTKPEGIAPKTAIDGYRTAGKTGTAQKANSACGCYKNYTVSFVEVAPADSPRFVAYVDLQNVGGKASGGGSAGPVAAQILKAALQKYQVPPSGSVAPDLALDW